jgi:dipeptidyl aminopeptidase/acylaminoacyl peptidase
MIKKIVLAIALLIFFSVIFSIQYTPSLSRHHGKVDARIYLSDSLNQPLIVAFGGGSGGNDWTRNYLKEKREEFLNRGYAVLAIGYFNTGNTPDALDRISLNAISDTIMSVARRYPQIDTNRIALLGGSKGGELILNLASRFNQYKAVVALSTSHISFPALTWSANTSSWMYNGSEVPYVPAPYETIFPALKGNLLEAFSIMLKNKEEVQKAGIAVEKINGPILILSAKNDEQWPATIMSEHLIKRLEENNFKHHFQHVVLGGGHVEPLNHFNYVYDFLNQHFK